MRDPLESRRGRASSGARERLARRLHASAPVRVADRAWLVRGRFPLKPLNVYLLEEDGGVALTSECVYTLDVRTSRKVEPNVPYPAFTADRDAARASMRKLTALTPSAAWPGHADPVTAGVAAQLERAAANG